MIPKTRLLIALSLLPSLGGVLVPELAAQQPAHAKAALALPAASALLDKALAATGGSQAWSHIKTASMKGKVVIKAMGIEGKSSLRLDLTKGLRFLQKLVLPGLESQKVGYDGQVMWQTSLLTGARIMKGKEKAITLRLTRPNTLVDWRKNYKTVKTVGQETVDGHACFKLRMIPKLGKPELIFLDQKSYLLWRQDVVIPTPGGDIPNSMIFKEYRKQGKLLLPFVTEIKTGTGQTIHLETVLFKLDEPLPKDLFKLPQKIQRLLPKKKAAASRPANHKGS